ncbi:hypothetical protein JVT61DRAFT_3610 [Boletus reticuloceps]|uniref:Asl1-like glycosyl hydrolase catalytic domain-containing protein n=1 Tax=Boletus reticuloceps TaxID=495285 RepID=A0A8I3A7S2_9AGAM|nr:hypothetical protein JVT61DRAFT_3610 [Boletus reticuloceps]
MVSSAFVLLSVFAAAAAAKGGKRCLAWPWYNAPLNPGVFNNGNGEVVAIYDWETYRPPSTNDTGGLEFIGMQRCLDCDSSPLTWLPARLQEQGWHTVFTLNEPDLNGITPGQAAEWYIEHINPLPVAKALPAVSSSVAPGQGLDWVSDMITACAGQCHFDYVNAHWYGVSFEQFKSFIEGAHARFPNYRLVISEYALQPPATQDDQVAFFKQALPFLDNADYVELHCIYVATSPALAEAHGTSPDWVGNCLYNDDGSPSAVGKLVLSPSSG